MTTHTEIMNTAEMIRNKHLLEIFIRKITVDKEIETKGDKYMYKKE